MTHRADDFIFRLTTICDKKCMLCCNNYDEIKKYESAPFNLLIQKFSDVSERLSHRDQRTAAPSFILTGGEALLYKSRADSGYVNLMHVIAAITSIIPGAKVIVKTGGFCNDNRFQLTLFDSISRTFSFPMLEWRFGWNLYQDEGLRSLDRLVCTATRMLNHQHSVVIDTIYDKTNLKDTCAALEEGLRRIGMDVNSDMISQFVLDDPNTHRRLTIKIAGYTFVLDLGPSYAPNKAATDHEYYSEPSSECETIHKGTSCLYYDTDMRLLHCNDSFVDARVPPRPCSSYSASEDLAFLNERFEYLRRFLALTGTKFESRKERCFFCTKFVMSDAADNDVRELLNREVHESAAKRAPMLQRGGPFK
ncbi:hypothetical protein ABH992_003295 [Bradyrhizobium yuanmingense]|uniref:4Fe4S-binding SPASM domain-containing protein n=1 Tax=Bradyrhizobium yuanmingense TaxID=108015 RepID=A0ABV4GG15_9BRAD